MERLNHIRALITKTRSRSPLAANSTILLGACKGQGAGVIEDFILAGLTDFGENRVQEAAGKWPALKKAHPEVRLHLIGPLQTNKVGEALELFDVIQTLDRPKLAAAIAKELARTGDATPAGGASPEHAPRSFQEKTPGATKEFFIQVNTGEEPQKSGVSPSETAEFISYCRNLRLNITGLMCVPPADDMPAPHFALLRKLALENGLAELSMGMSGDFETAIRMGSGCVRIGTALFGERSPQSPT